MQYPSAFITLFAATAVLSIPLNINMGAYSPALVVGDGAIGFKGAENVAQIMNTLQGAAASGATANGAAAAAPAAAASGQAQSGITKAGVADEAAAAPAAPAGEAVVAQGELPQGMGKSVVARDEELEDLYRRLTADEEEEIDEETEIEDAEKRSLSADEQEEIDEETAIEDAEKRSLSPDDIEEIDEETEIEDAEKRSLSPADIEEIDEETDIEDAEKRDLTAAEQEEIDEEVDIEDAEKKVKSKRDMAGFTAALNFATGALKSSPEVQLGTGEGGSGVGITQKLGGTTGTAPARTNGTARAVARSVVRVV